MCTSTVDAFFFVMSLPFCIETEGSFGDGSFIPSLELAIESTFACADTKSLDLLGTVFCVRSE